MQHIAFIGVGGVGGYFGGKMAQIMDHKTKKLYFIARGNHLKAIQEKGLILNTNDEGSFICKPDLATDDICDLPLLDICFICVKSYDLEKVLLQLQSRISEKTMIIPLLNGVDIYDRIRAIIKQGTVLPACVYVGTHIKEPGKVEQNGGACTILFGKDPNHLEIDGEEVARLLDEAHIKYRFTDKHIEEIWKKYLFIAAYGLVTASENKTLGEVYENPASSKKVRGIMREIVTVGQAEGVELDESLVEESYQKAVNFPYETKTSFQRDYEANKPDERELLGKTMLTLAEKHHIEVPLIAKVYEAINRRN